MPTLTRRRFLSLVPALAATPTLIAQTARPPVRLKGFNHVTLSVTDLQRSLDFYQGLFGLDLESRQGSQTAALQVGGGPQHIGLTTSPSSGVRTPRIDHMCLGIDDMDVDSMLKHLSDHGITRSEQRGAMRVVVRMRDPSVGGSASGTPEVYLGDPDGVLVQLQDSAYCGGSGPRGSICASPVPSPHKGLLTPVGFSHCTVHSSDPERSNRFYRELFGTGIQSYQGEIPTLAVGPGVEFLVNNIPSNAAQSTPGTVNHFCLTVDRFDPARVIETLERYGIKPRESETGRVPPLRHYTKVRREDQGGAREGTPELYFTDPDGILVQLQDVSYCGGSGVLGNICPLG